MILMNLMIELPTMLLCLIVQAAIAFWSVRYYVRQTLAATSPRKFGTGLRTLLVATTAAAIYIGGILALFRTVDQSSASSPFALVHVISGLFIFVLWCVAGEWAFRHRSSASSARLMLAAILTAAFWPVVYSYLEWRREKEGA